MSSLDAIGIVVADMGRSLEFYGLLGLDAPAGAAAEGHVEIEVAPGFRLMLDTIEVIERFSTYEPPSGGRPITLALRCDAPAEVDAMFGAVADAGDSTKAEPFDAFWGQPYATVLDPDRNPVDLYVELG